MATRKHGASLLEQYGRCIVPKGTLLYRGHVSKQIQPCMFFMLKFFLTSDHDDFIQIWKTKRKIELVFLVEYITKHSHAISAIPKVYAHIFPAEADRGYDDLDVKQRNLKRRNKFVRKLNRFGLKGWLSSLEDNPELEICLFNPSQDDLVFEKLENRRSEKFYKDSLNKIEVLPAPDFYTKTYRVLTAEYGSDLGKIGFRKKHHQWKKLCIADFHGKSSSEMKKSAEKLNDLRTKLNI